MDFWRIFRKKKYVKVECWFCKTTTTVPAGNVNCFDCPECEQYNGFTKDGGYNKPIPAQYSEELNQTYSRPSPDPDDLEPRPSPFCDVCQTNQELKVQQLASFIPSHENNFDVEVKQYSDYLEEAYRLCPACSDNLYSELHGQDVEIRSRLLGQRLKQTVMPNAQDFMPVQRDPSIVFLLRSLAVVAAVLIVIGQARWSVQASGLPKEDNASILHKAFLHFPVLDISSRMTMSLVGLVCGVFSSLLAGKYRLKHLDCVCSLLWMMYMGSITAPPSFSSLLASFPWLPVDAIPFVLSAFVLLGCTKHALQSRARPTKKVFAKRRLRDQPGTPVEPEDDEEPMVMPRPSEPSSSSSHSASLNQSLQSESGEIRRILLDQDIGGLSLGPPLLTRAKNKDVWTAHTPPTSRPGTPLLEERPPSREFRPIISPATFNPCGMKRSASQSSFVSSFSGAFVDAGPSQDQRVSSSRENLRERGRGSSLPMFGDDSSDGSLPLGMNAKENTVAATSEHKTSTQGWTSCLLPGFLGFSLGINCAAALYVLYGR